MATQYNNENALLNQVSLLISENESLRNSLGVSVLNLQTETTQRGVQIDDHENRITALETP